MESKAGVPSGGSTRPLVFLTQDQDKFYLLYRWLKHLFHHVKGTPWKLYCSVSFVPNERADNLVCGIASNTVYLQYCLST